MTKEERQKHIQEFFGTLQKVFRDLKRRGDFPFKDYQLSHSQVQVMFLLAHNQTAMTLKEIAQEMDVTSGAVSQVVDELVKNDFVSRTEDVNDRRVIRLALKERAKTLLHEWRTDFFCRLEPLFDSLSDQEVETLNNLMAKVRQAKLDQENQLKKGQKEC